MAKVQQGYYHSLIINSQNEVYSFGYNHYGQLGHGDTTNRNTPTLLDFYFNGVPINIQQGYWYSIILTDNNKVYSFGYNYYGQLGLGDYNNRNIPTLINYQFDGNIIDIQQGGSYFIILTDIGKVYGSGLNNIGQLGLGDKNNRNTPTLIDYQFDGVPIKISQSSDHSMILTDNNKVYSFGDNYYGQLGIGNTTNRTIPTLINYQFDGKPISIQQGYQHSMILTDTGKVYSFGHNQYGQLGLGDYNRRLSPTLINYSFDGNPISIQQGQNHSIVFTDADKVYSFGYNYYGQLGLGDYNNRNIPTLINYSFDGNIIDIQQGGWHSLILTDAGKIYATGLNNYGQLGLGDNDNRNIFSEKIIEQYNLYISQDPINGGIIKLNNQTISTPYAEQFEINANITIEQIPNDGYEFIGWEEE